MKKFALCLMLSLSVSCAHARHLGVMADASFSAAVFAIDDAETAACQQHVLSPETCAQADARIAAALQDVKAVTLALQATPKNVAVPKNIPDLLTDLTSLQGIVAPLANAPSAPVQVQTLGQQITVALSQTIAVVRTFTGGK
jgi:hypothetical protein